MTFIFQHIVTFIFTKRLGRFYEFPSILHVTDTILFVCSIIIIQWIKNDLCDDLYSDNYLPEREFNFRVVQNLANSLEFKFQYLFSVMMACLILRVAVIL